ncbi:MAG: YitT family protein [Eubacteriales bacterium]|nr:YitT family protein [Eubacteriales bacterium]
MKITIYKQWIRDAGVDMAGGLFVGIGLYNFAANADFPMAGFSGIALILYRLFHIPMGISVIVMNVPVALFCYRLLGRSFFLNSVRSLAISSFMMDYVAPLFPVYDGEQILAAICTGLFSGLGYAIIFMNGSSTGGIDFITMAIRAKRPHLSLGKIIFVLDCVVVLLGGLILKDMDAFIYGILITYIMTTVMDKILCGPDKGKTAMIITQKGLSIAGIIDHYTDRGSTILKGIGSYSGKEKDVVLCACTNKQMYVIRKMVKKADPHAFIVIMDSSEAVGEGFQTE